MKTTTSVVLKLAFIVIVNAVHLAIIGKNAVVSHDVLTMTSFVLSAAIEIALVYIIVVVNASEKAVTHQIVNVQKQGKFKIPNDLDIIYNILRRGVSWEEHIQDIITFYLGPGDNAIDIGSHIGSHTMPMANAVLPGGIVFAVEPMYVGLLNDNIVLNGVTNVVTLPFAMTDVNNVDISMSSSSQNAGGSFISDCGDISVRGRTLDSFLDTSDVDVPGGLPTIKLIKIDVEGSEIHALKGAVNLISRDHPIIVIEIWKKHISEVSAYLRVLGYSVERIDKDDYLAIFNQK